MGVLIAKGFFEGSNTVSENPDDSYDPSDCMHSLDHIHKSAHKAFDKI